MKQSTKKLEGKVMCMQNSKEKRKLRARVMHWIVIAKRNAGSCVSCLLIKNEKLWWK